MIEIPITDDDIEKAKVLAEDLGRLNKSITSGQGNLSGFVGEVVLETLLQVKQNNSYDYDLVARTGKTIDVKTKRTKVKPKDYYECSIAAYNTKQQCDYYAFCRVNNQLDTLWFLGMIEKSRYFEIARFLKKGSKDGDNGYIVKADCYNLDIKTLWDEFNKLIP